MTKVGDIKNINRIDHLAEQSGLAISFVDASRNEVHISNNNSICRKLNPGRGFSPDCDKYCGAAFERATSSGQIIQYRCHAGLDCRAVSMKAGSSSLAAVVGRTFTDTNQYKRATERAISGDWSRYSPNEMFDNVLITGSPGDLENTVIEVRDLADRGLGPSRSTSEPDTTDGRTAPEIDPETSADEERDEQNPVDVSSIKISDRHPPGERSSEVTEWRSFFGSLMELNYPEASAAALEFVSRQFGLRSLVWLKRDGRRLEKSIGLGKFKDRGIRLALSSDDKRLIAALADGVPLELGERSKGPRLDRQNKMTIFPIGITGEVSAAIAVLDPVDDRSKREKLARFCRSISQQFEILRLRSDVERGDTEAAAVRRFSEVLKKLSDEDLWTSLTQNAAEILKAERSSILLFDEHSGKFEAKAILGIETPFPAGEELGQRIAKYVYTSGKAIAVGDIAKAGIPADLQSKHYKTPSFLSSPVSVGGRVIGVMSFADRADGNSFGKASLELFEAIAPQIALAIDRADLKEKAGQFEQLSVTDALTGLLNRRYMEERLMEETRRSNRHGYPMSFMMLDVDEFKSYNDNFGHPAGDDALRLVANVIRDTLRSADVAVRFGGEEFAILLPQTTNQEGRTIAERLRSNIEQTRFPHRPVTISIGISSCSAELCRDADLISAADKALYRAKRGGRNRVLAFEDETPVTSERRA